MGFKAPSSFEWFPAVKADVAFIVCLRVNAFPPQDFSCARVTSSARLTLDGFKLQVKSTFHMRMQSNRHDKFLVTLSVNNESGEGHNQVPFLHIMIFFTLSRDVVGQTAFFSLFLFFLYFFTEWKLFVDGWLLSLRPREWLKHPSVIENRGLRLNTESSPPPPPPQPPLPPKNKQ